MRFCDVLHYTHIHTHVIVFFYARLDCWRRRKKKKQGRASPSSTSGQISSRSRSSRSTTSGVTTSRWACTAGERGWGGWCGRPPACLASTVLFFVGCRVSDVFFFLLCRVSEVCTLFLSCRVSDVPFFGRGGCPTYLVFVVSGVGLVAHIV